VTPDLWVKAQGKPVKPVMKCLISDSGQKKSALRSRNSSFSEDIRKVCSGTLLSNSNNPCRYHFSNPVITNCIVLLTEGRGGNSYVSKHRLIVTVTIGRALNWDPKHSKFVSQTDD
jgi:hypothetical protein